MKTVTSLFIASAWHSMSMWAAFFSAPSPRNKASLCLLGNTCIRLGMLGGKGHTPVSNWNAIMYELTWLQGCSAGGGGVIERWIPACDVWLLPYSAVDIPEVMEHEWGRHLHADGEGPKGWALPAGNSSISPSDQNPTWTLSFHLVQVWVRLCLLIPAPVVSPDLIFINKK